MCRRREVDHKYTIDLAGISHVWIVKEVYDEAGLITKAVTALFLFLIGLCGRNRTCPEVFSGEV